MKYNILIFFIILSLQLHAQWSNDPNTNLQLTNWGELPISLISDGIGGAFVSAGKSTLIDKPPWAVFHNYLFWIDKYGKHNLDIVNRLAGKGDAVRDMTLIEDGKGKYLAIFVDKIWKYYYDGTNFYNDKIMVQKFDSLGNKLWGDGVYVTLDTTDNIAYEYALDGEGGCYISWNATDEWGINHGRQVIQHLSKEGQRLWSDTGKVMCIDPFYQDNIPIKVVSDAQKGIYVRYSPQNNKQYFYANIDFNGNILWQVPSRITSAYSDDTNITSDSLGKLFCIGFSTPENSLTTSLHYESISVTGNYNSDLIELLNSNALATKIWEFMNQDSLLIFTWAEYNSEGYTNYFQVLDKKGILKFNNKGMVPFNSLSNLNREIIKSNNDFILTCNNEAQKLNLEGEFLWGENPIIFTNRKMVSPVFTTDGNGGFIALWQDQDIVGIFGQQVNVHGQLGTVLTSVDFNNIINNNFVLLQNYPNPFNPSTMINFAIPQKGFVQLKVYDILGKEVAVLVNEEKNIGNYEINFDASYLSSGVYFYKMQVGYFAETRKMVLLR